MRTGDTCDTENSADEDALAQVREGESASFGSWNFERSEFRDKSITISVINDHIIFTKNIIKIEFES